jgi:endonuclease/exonuclease/phosphatase family metal-dependent hydrolase
MTKVVSWNVHRATGQSAAWRAIESLEPDFALFQEVSPPPNIDPKRLVWQPIPGRHWGSAIYAADGIELTPLEIQHTYPGWVAAADARKSDGSSLTVISLHAPIVDGYSIAPLHRILSDLTTTLDRRRSRVILGGDFNASPQWDERQGNPSHRILFDRLMAFRLKSCLPLDGDYATYRHNKGTPVPWRLDYIFVSETTQIASARVLEDETLAALSDHTPVLANVDQAWGKPSPVRRGVTAS